MIKDTRELPSKSSFREQLAKQSVDIDAFFLACLETHGLYFTDITCVSERVGTARLDMISAFLFSEIQTSVGPLVLALDTRQVISLKPRSLRSGCCFFANTVKSPKPITTNSAKNSNGTLSIDRRSCVVIFWRSRSCR